MKRNCSTHSAQSSEGNQKLQNAIIIIIIVQEEPPSQRAPPQIGHSKVIKLDHAPLQNLRNEKFTKPI